MYLKSLHSEPSGLFNTGKTENPHVVFFKDGINFIFGKKTSNNQTKDSLNGIGKSSILNLIDFCLLSDFNARNPRLWREKNKLLGYSIILKIEISNVEYIIKRGFQNPKKVFFGKSVYSLQEYEIDDFKEILFDMIFYNPSYLGVLNKSWYRTLIAFFVKIHKRKGQLFEEPTEFLVSQANKLIELNQYHFFFMNIDNTLICEHYNLQKDVNDKKIAFKHIKKLIEEVHHINIKEVGSEINKLDNDIRKVQRAIESFRLAEQHKDFESKMNELTLKIKDLYNQNYWDNEKIKAYKESYNLQDILNERQVKTISKLYAELQQELGTFIRKSLDEAISFRTSLANSRSEFLKEEMKLLETNIKKRLEEIQKLDIERSKFFLILQSKEAFKDLTEAFTSKGKLQEKLFTLKENYQTYSDLEKELQNYNLESQKLTIEMTYFLESIQSQINNFERIFTDVYNHIYPHRESSGFSIQMNSNLDAKINISIVFPDDESKGKNSGRTLTYDIAIMLNAIIKSINLPRFLIHDGIFDGMDKSHFVELYHYVKSLQNEGQRFQYIVTLNEEGEIKENFGNTDDLTTEKIVDEAIVVLTPEKKLWNV